MAGQAGEAEEIVKLPREFLVDSRKKTTYFVAKEQKVNHEGLVTSHR